MTPSIELLIVDFSMPGMSGIGVWTPKKEDMAAAAAKWEGKELEDAFMTSGGCGAFARTTEEWAQHPQAAAVAPLPLVEIVRIGDAPPEPLPRGERPPAGVRVLDLTRVLAGPTCARTLAEHGADVLKITAPHLPNSGSVELDTGLGKLSAHLDLRNQQDVETLRTLVRGADVFSQSYRPGALASRGFSPEALAEMCPASSASSCVRGVARVYGASGVVSTRSCKPPLGWRWCRAVARSRA